MHFPKTLAALAGTWIAVSYAAPQGTTAVDNADPAAVTKVYIHAPEETAPLQPENVTSVVRVGAAHVDNHCNFPVFLYVCGPRGCGLERTLPAHTGSYVESYYPPNFGRSIKLGLVPGEVAKPILQFEYASGAYNYVWYDLSEVNGHPFDSLGTQMTSNDPHCFQQTCHPHQPGCVFYRGPNDNPAIRTCAITADIGVVLCTG